MDNHMLKQSEPLAQSMCQNKIWVSSTGTTRAAVTRSSKRPESKGITETWKRKTIELVSKSIYFFSYKIEKLLIAYNPLIERWASWKQIHLTQMKNRVKHFRAVEPIFQISGPRRTSRSFMQCTTFVAVTMHFHMIYNPTLMV